ncbi:MAG: hypothetical protein N3B12_03985 [Armatimonadetes bacterium]|nr:hypothetical protein [Armatimonadota bacterium]
MLLFLVILVGFALGTGSVNGDVSNSRLSAHDKKTAIPYTSFQTPTGYLPENDIRTDAVIVYSNLKDRIQSWKDKGYVVQTMYGFRAGPDYVKDHVDEVQTTADGTLLTCGPDSYYMVPTPSRIKAAVDYFTDAIANGTSAVIPEEPEFFAIAGYSDSFKRAWQEYYGEPWQDPSSSIEARYKSERLKAKMEFDVVKAIMDAAEKQDPNVCRMVACHSAVTYYAWGIIYPHYECFSLPNLQEIIGQVWTGTARTECRYEGAKAERTFENGFLEYSSLYNLVRGSGKRMWFLMDPVEDNPDRTMEDYRDNYEKTLVASLMFPEVDAYEVMPWPTRIYGRVPDEFATEIGSIINALQDMHNYTPGTTSVLRRGRAGGAVKWDTGTREIATFVADSMGWQRGEPHMSNYDCFYGLTLPLVYKGIPIQVAQLERSPEKGYLDHYKVILMSYDIMKPMKPEYNQAIADWVKKGGVLVFFGGTDAYNALPEWWSKQGFVSPQEDLYARLGIRDRLVSHIAPEEYREIDREDEPLRDGSNRKVYRYELDKLVGQAGNGGTLFVRFRDAFPGDGYGPAVHRTRLILNGKVRVDFAAGGEAEKKYLAIDNGSFFNGRVRFADRDTYWVYRFTLPANSKPVLEVDMQNQFVIEVCVNPEAAYWSVRGKALFEKKGYFEVPSQFPLTVAFSREDRGVPEQLYSGPDGGSVIFEYRYGKGMLIHVGVAPSYFASSKEAADILRKITVYACEKAGIKYREQGRMAIRRGPYVAVRTFNEEKKLRGHYVNILDPKLSVVKDPLIGAWNCALYVDVSDQVTGVPKLLYSSSKVEFRSESATKTVLKLSGPLNTKGVARVFAGSRQIQAVSLPDARIERTSDSVLLSYDNKPEPIELVITWR